MTDAFCQGVAGYFVVAYMRAELHKPFLLFGKLEEVLVAFDVNLELLSGIHGKLIDNSLSEQTMVDVCLPCRFQR